MLIYISKFHLISLSRVLLYVYLFIGFLKELYNVVRELENSNREMLTILQKTHSSPTKPGGPFFVLCNELDTFTFISHLRYTWELAWWERCTTLLWVPSETNSDFGLRRCFAKCLHPPTIFWVCGAIKLFVKFFSSALFPLMRREKLWILSCQCKG